VVAVFLLGTGYFFLSNIFLTGDATMAGTFMNMGILMLLVLPVMSMRLFAAETSAGTMELLLTVPLSPWQIVLGKYLGAVTILLAIAAGTLVDVVPIYLYGDPDTLTILSGYVGFVLLGMACLAIGQLCSALTENQIIAALATTALLLGFWFVGHLQAYQTTVAARDLVRTLSFALHYGDFIQGLIRSEAIAFYAVISAIALVLNAAWLEWQR
jgi:ABC-2 type transport system permease protein